MHKSKLFILAAIALVMAGFTLQSCEDEGVGTKNTSLKKSGEEALRSHG